MRNTARYFSKQIGRIIPSRLLFTVRTPLFLPFYHVVSDNHLPYICNYPYRNTTEFEKELDFFLHHFEPVSLSEIVNKKTSSKKSFHLSFDDGLKQCADVIAPVLLKKGIPATFFINTAFVDNKSLFHRYKASLVYNKIKNSSLDEVKTILKENSLSQKNLLQTNTSQSAVLDNLAKLLQIDFDAFLKTEAPYLTSQQIHTLHKQGFSIGAHSHTHPEMWTLSQEQQLEEIKTSINWIVRNFNPKIKAFSFPFTDDGIRADLLTRIFEENICDITFGTAGLKYDSFENHLQRYPVEQNGNFILNLKAEWVYFKIRQLTGKAKVQH